MLYMHPEGGQGLVEYALLIAFVALIVLLIIAVLGDQIYNLWNYVVTCLPEPPSPSDPNYSLCYP